LTHEFEFPLHFSLLSQEEENGFIESPPAAHLYVRLALQFLRALYPELL
jgi:hypothetical protein